MNALAADARSSRLWLKRVFRLGPRSAVYPGSLLPAKTLLPSCAPRRIAMPIERVPGSSSLIDILDRILDKGIVVDGWPRISLDGIDVMSNHARVVVVSRDSSLGGH